MRPAAALLATLALTSCASDPPAPAGCSPGEQRACLCAGGSGSAASVELCGPGGTFGACDCPDGSTPMDNGTADVGAPLFDGGTDVGAVDRGAEVLAVDLGADTSADLGADTGVAEASVDVPPADRPEVVDAAPADLGAMDTGADAPTPLDAGSDTGTDLGADAGTPDTGPDVADVPAAPVDLGGMDSGTDTGPRDTGADVVDVPDVVDLGPPDTGPACSNDAIRCTADATGVERCVGGAWTLTRGCGLSAADDFTGFCEDNGCHACRRSDAGPRSGCGASTCATNDDCYRQGWGTCTAGQCARRGILPCASPPDCLPWIIAGVTSACTADVRDLNGDMVRACTGSLVMPCTANAMCPNAYRCDLRNGRCVAR